MWKLMVTVLYWNLKKFPCVLWKIFNHFICSSMTERKIYRFYISNVSLEVSPCLHIPRPIEYKMKIFLHHTISDSMFFNYRILLHMDTTSSLKFDKSSLLPRYSLVGGWAYLVWQKLSGLWQTWPRGGQVGTPEVKFNKMPC